MFPYHRNISLKIVSILILYGNQEDRLMIYQPYGSSYNCLPEGGDVNRAIDPLENLA